MDTLKLLNGNFEVFFFVYGYMYVIYRNLYIVCFLRGRRQGWMEGWGKRNVDSSSKSTVSTARRAVPGRIQHKKSFRKNGEASF